MTAWDSLRAMNQMPDDWIEEALAPKIVEQAPGHHRLCRRIGGLCRHGADCLAALDACPACGARRFCREENNRPNAAQDAITAAPAQDGAQSSAESAAQGEENGVFVPAEPEKGVTIPETPLPKVSEGLSFDMAGFFIHNGRMYVQTGETAPAGLRGSYVFTPTGQIHEWSGAEEYVEGASSVGGDVYTVEGYDESFRLCLADENGTFSLYDCLGGVTLKTGRIRLKPACTWRAAGRASPSCRTRRGRTITPTTARLP